MKTYLELEFVNSLKGEQDNTPFKLRWAVLDKSYATLWLRSLFQSFKKKEPAYFRFTGFKNSPKDMSFLSKKLNKAIDIINQDGLYRIEERAQGTFSQDFANVIHHHFEVLFGDAKNFSDLYKNSSPVGQGAISDLNHCIHDMEALTRSQEFTTSTQGIVLEILDRKQYWLTDDVLKDFTFDIEFGDLLLHYGLVGKTWWEVFLDKDEDIFPEAIRPLDVLGGEFDIQFSNKLVSPSLVREFYEFLKSHGQDPSDPKLALGFLPLAKLEMPDGLSKDEISKKIGERSGIKGMRIYEEGREWINVDLSESATINDGFFHVNSLIVLRGNDSIPIRPVPIQAFYISGEGPRTVLAESLFSGPYIDGGHSISLIVPKDGQSVILKCGSAPRGLNASNDILISPGESVHLSFNNHGSYNVIKFPKSKAENS